MKRTCFLLCIFCAFTLVSACAAPAQTPAISPATQTVLPSPNEDEARLINVSIQEYSDMLVDEAGKTLATVSSKYPVLVFEGDNAVLTTLNSEILSQERAWADEVLKQCKQTLTPEAVAQAGDFFTPYEYERTWIKTCLTEELVSFKVDYMQYAGGAHPDGAYYGYTYNLDTGTPLGADDIFADVAEADKLMRDGFMEQIKAEAENFYDEAAGILSSGAQLDESLYLTPDGATFALPSYTIAPNTFGIPVFTIVYAGNETLFKVVPECAK
ncbi:MAG: DUF4163 domain-containing protein [Clostridia bacterium]